MHRIAFVALPGFRMMSLASLSAFELANSEAGEPVYELHLLSETGGLVPTSLGFGIMTEPLDGPLDKEPFDTVIVGGSIVPGALTPGVIAFLQRAVQQSRRVAATSSRQATRRGQARQSLIAASRLARSGVVAAVARNARSRNSAPSNPGRRNPILSSNSNRYRIK